MGRPSWRPCVKTSRCSPAPTSHTSSFGLRSPRRSEQGASRAPRSPGPGAGWSGCGPRPLRSSWTCRWRSGPETWPRATASVATMRCIWPLCSAWGPRAWCIVWRAGMTICVAPPLMRAMRFSRCRPPCPPLPKVFPPGPNVGLELIDRGADPVPRLGAHPDRQVAEVVPGVVRLQVLVRPLPPGARRTRGMGPFPEVGAQRDR